MFAVVMLNTIQLLVNSESGTVDYLRDVKPILMHKCVSCHGALRQRHALRLDTAVLAKKGGQSGPALIPGNAAMSLIMKRVRGHVLPRMPFAEEALSSKEIQILTGWINQGARGPEKEAMQDGPERHWAFQSPRRVEFSKAESKGNYLRNPIDILIARGHAQRGLKPNPPAEPSILLRRVYLDLIGLPPTVQQQQEFLENPTKESHEKIVDQLLSQYQYGERWGRHWMDIWRYSDWYGRREQDDVRNSASQIWRWRDWIVDSLNHDKGYDRMVQEMLAADELFPEDDSTWPATGYLIRNFYSLNANEWMRDNVEYTGKAFLGLTFNCAHCHDHKYDPIEHMDYFRMRAFFEPIGIRQDQVAGEKQPPEFEPYAYGGSRRAVKEGIVRIYDEKPDATTWFYTGGDERNRDKQRGSIPPGVPSFLSSFFPEVSPVELPTMGWYSGFRESIQQTQRDMARVDINEAQQVLDAADMSAREPITSLREQLKLLQKEFAESEADVLAEGQPGPLEGAQSLFIDATEGRRIYQNHLPDLKAISEGMQIGYQLRILKDNHVNVQLVKSNQKFLTAGYVAFEKGGIFSYGPGGYTRFEVGKYNFSRGEVRFKVTLTIYPQRDLCDLSVELLNEEGECQRILGSGQVALNGWSPIGNPDQPLVLDCRSGTRVLFDDLQIAADSDVLIHFDFESPRYGNGQDIVGIDHWELHTQSENPAQAFTSRAAGNPKLFALKDQMAGVRKSLKSMVLSLQANQIALDARQSRLKSIEDIILADRGRYSRMPEEEKIKRIRQAVHSQLASDFQLAEADLIKARADVAKANTIDDEDQQKKKIQSSTEKVREAIKRRDAVTALRDKMPEDYRPLSVVTSRSSTGRRAALALWMTDRRNPLTARVAVNHIWMRHFGAPLVTSVFDFGRNGKKPLNPELLDWLSVELIDSGWSMKHLHKLMVTSNTYAMSSDNNTESAALDKDNQFLWKTNVGRMEAELVRDSILYVSGTLDQSLGGISISNTHAMTGTRRTLYYELFPEAGGTNAIGELFDAPNPAECYRRSMTIVPQQALALINSDFVHQVSMKLEERILLNQPSLSGAAFVHLAFRTILSRPPHEQEKMSCLEFMKQTENVQKARQGLIRVLFNHNDFVTIR